MGSGNPKKPKKLVYREQDFEMYVLWKSLPSIFRGKNRDELEKAGITDEAMIDLLSIKNQTQFAKRFEIPDVTTLTDWNKKIEEHDLLKEKRKFWLKKLTGNVMGAFYRHTMKEGDAARVKLWNQLSEEWKEKQDHTVHIDKIEDLIKKLAGE